MITRRAFLKITMLTPFIFKGTPERLYAKTEPPLKEASYYHRIDEKKMIVACQLCPRECVIAEGETGFCKARKNIKGTLYALGYAQPCACLLYTSDAADDLLCVDLGGRRIIKKKTHTKMKQKPTQNYTNY